MSGRDQPHLPGRGPLDARAMRQQNLSLLLGELVRQGPSSQARLVAVTGLKKATVSRLLEELVRLGWVHATGAEAGLVGRPRTLFAPDPRQGVVVSARITLAGLSVTAVDFGGERRRSHHEEMDVAARPQPEVRGRLARAVQEVLDPTRPVLGAALALPGTVDGGRLGYAPGLAWPDRDATGLLRATLLRQLVTDAPLVVGNEARFAAVAEQRYGVAAGVDDFVYLLGGVGIGAGVVADGRVFEGSRGAAGEVGHVSVTLEGRRCSCGKTGCWATLVSETELVRLTEPARTGGTDEKLGSFGRGGPTQAAASFRTAGDVVAASRAGDPVATQAVGQVRRALAAGIGNLVSVYDPELVVLGGFLADWFGDDLSALRAEVDEWVMGGRAQSVLRLEASHLEDASVLGGVALVHDRVVRVPRRR